MLKIKNLRGECQHCGGPIEFHAEHTGSTATCPHCGEQTELLLPPPPQEESPVRRKAIVFAVVALLILLGGLIATGIALKRAQRLQNRPAPPPAAGQVAAPVTVATGPFAAQEFGASPVSLAQGQGSSVIYAVGTVTNLSSRSRFGVKVELEIHDRAGTKLAGATDYQKVIEPNAEWKFRALVLDKQAAAARVIAITEAAE